MNRIDSIFSARAPPEAADITSTVFAVVLEYVNVLEAFASDLPALLAVGPEVVRYCRMTTLPLSSPWLIILSPK